MLPHLFCFLYWYWRQSMTNHSDFEQGWLKLAENLEFFSFLSIFFDFPPLCHGLLTAQKYANIALTTTITLRIAWHLCLLLLVRLGGYIVNLSDFYSYRLTGKLTVFFNLQEFNLRNPPVDYSTSTVWFSLNSSKTGLVWLSLRRQIYVLCLI